MISTNLKILLAERSLTISKVCEDTGISRTTLTALCSNKSKGIQFDTLDTLCNYLNVLPEDILTFSPYRISFKATHQGVYFVIENRIQHRKNEVFASLDKNNDLAVEIDKVDTLNKVISSLPKFYINILNEELKNLLIDKLDVQPDDLSFFSITTNLY